MTTVQIEQKGKLVNKLIERGREFERYRIDEKTFKVVLGVPTWVKDDAGKYVPYVVNTHDDHVTVKSGLVSYNIYSDRLEYWDSGMTELRATERIAIQIEKNRIELSFARRHVAQAETGVFVTQTYNVLQDDVKLGELDVTYEQRAGEPLNHILETRDLPKGLAKSVHFSWTFPTTVDEIEISRSIGGQQRLRLGPSSTRVDIRNSENARITKQGRLWINEITGFNKENLKEMEASNSELMRVYSSWDDQIMLDHAATFTNSNPTQDGFVYTNPATAGCGPAAGKVYIMYDVMYTAIPPAGANGSCYFLYVEWETSPVPSGANVTQVNFRYHVELAYNPAVCDVVKIPTQPSASASNAPQILQDIQNNANIVLDKTDAFYVAGPDRILPLDPAKVNIAGKPFLALGVKYSNPGRDANPRYLAIKTREAAGAAHPVPTLEVYYT